LLFATHTLPHRLRLIAPVIQDHGIDYERGKFADKLRDGTLTLSRTTEWFHKTMTEKSEVAILAREGCRISAMELHADAIVSLLSTGAKVTAETAPETLAFDVSRLVTMQLQFESLLCMQAAILIVNKTSDQELVKKVTATIDAMEPGAPLEVETLGLPTSVAAHVAMAIKPESGLSLTLRKKLCNLLRRNIVNTSPVACGQHLATLAHDVRRMAILNREVHTNTYNTIIRDFPDV
jgi:hypothetical protein